MSYKLIALDIDGTIRSQEYPLSERTRQAISSATEAGAVVTLATGRTFRSAARSSADLNLETPIAAAQGAYIAHPVTDEILMHRTMTPQMAIDAFNALSDWDGFEVVAYHRHDVYVRRMTEWAEGYGQRNGITINVTNDLEELASKELTRLVVVGDEGRIESLESSLKSQFDGGLHVTRSLAHFCEILHPNGGKHKALEWLCDHYSIEYESTVAFGNGYNDVHMLTWAGLGVAIGGAVPEVLEVADRVSPPIEEDGVAQVIEDLLEQDLIG